MYFNQIFNSPSPFSYIQSLKRRVCIYVFFHLFLFVVCFINLLLCIVYFVCIVQKEDNIYSTGYGNPPPNTFEVTTQPQSQAGQPEPPPGVLVVQPRPTYIISHEHFKPYSTKCPNCRAQITTETTFQVGTLAKMWIFILCCSL